MPRTFEEIKANLPIPPYVRSKLSETTLDRLAEAIFKYESEAPPPKVLAKKVEEE